MLSLDLGKCFKNLIDIEREFDPGGIPERGEGGERNPWQNLARSVRGKVARQSKGSGIIPEREIGLGLDEARPIQAAVHEECGANCVYIVEGEAPIEALQIVPRGGIVIDGVAKRVASTPDPQIISRSEEELVSIGEVDV